MARVTRGFKGRRRHKKWLKLAKGAQGRRKTIYKAARATAEKGLQHAYVARKLNKREYRSLWIQRINAAAREHGLTYSRLIAGLKAAGVEVDRKVLADVAIADPKAWADLIALAKQNAPAAPAAA